MRNNDELIEQALTDLQQGRMIIVQDSASRENEGDLVMAAEHAQEKDVNFMITHARGLLCMPMSAASFERLRIPMMVSHNRSKQHTPFGVSIGAVKGITTGISAAERALTLRVAANPCSQSNDIVMPGHIFPLCAQPQGVLVRPGHTEASVDLMTLAGLSPAAAICEVMNADGTMARGEALGVFAKRHDLTLITIDDLVNYRLRKEILVEQKAQSFLPIQGKGEFDVRVFVNHLDDVEHMVISSRTKSIAPHEAPLVRVHSECLTGDVFGSARCDCGQQLDLALQQIATSGGMIIYLRSHEGRGVGLANKIKAYALQDGGCDTVEANQRLGLPIDARDYMCAAHMLRAMGITAVRLLTNNPNKISHLERLGVAVTQRVSVQVDQSKANAHYLTTKRDKLGHLLTLEEVC